MKEKVETHQDSAVMSKKLATIFREVPLEQQGDALAYSGYDADALGADVPQAGIQIAD